jgi:PAS domain S-box-containing protein
MHLRISDSEQRLQAPAESQVVIPSDAYHFNDQFEELLESVYDAVLLTLLDGRLRKSNSRALNFLGYTQEELYRLNFMDVISGADPDVLATIRESVTKERRVFIEAYCLCKDGTEFPAEITVSLINMGQSRKHLCFFIRNIASRKKTELALQQAQRDLLKSAHQAGMAEIATGVLHNVGNLVNSINVSCEMILSLSQTPTLEMLNRANELIASQDNLADFYARDPRAKKLPQLYGKVGGKLEVERQKLRDEANNLAQKLQNIRDVISMQQAYAKTNLFVEEVNVNELIEDALEILRSSLIRHSLRIEKRFAECPMIKGQKAKLVNIFVNLIMNAKDAMGHLADQNRRLLLTTERTANQVLVSVQDNGEGVAPENIDKIFNHGFTTKDSGHGFGLHTCANFMTEMNGQIRVSSDGLGKGTVFHLSFPLSEEGDEKE